MAACLEELSTGMSLQPNLHIQAEAQSHAVNSLEAAVVSQAAVALEDLHGILANRHPQPVPVLVHGRILDLFAVNCH